MPPKKGPQEKVEARNTLVAVVLADSFTQRFRPITVERPKVLLPLVHTPMLEYTLEWLSMNKVEEVWVFCCAHADQVTKYLEQSKWQGSRSDMKVRTIVSTNCLSAGEAMRSIDQRDIIKSDFILVSGDTVSNCKLAPIMEAHRARRAADKNAIMTMVVKSAAHPAQRLRLGDTEMRIAMSSHTQRLLKCQEYDAGQAPPTWKLDAAFFSEHDSVQVRSDLMDTNIAICAPEVLMLFSDNFDYQNIRRDFISGVLSEEELGNKLYIHQLTNEYAARVHNLRSYDAISRDILQRWVFPFVPDTNLLNIPGPWGASSYRLNRGQRYLEGSVNMKSSTHLEDDVCIGASAHIGEGTVISQSVIGRGCVIGNNVRIYGSYIQDNCRILDGAVIRAALICEGVQVGPGAVLEPGVILSYNVVIGRGHRVPANSRITLCQQTHATAGGSDDETEYSTATPRKAAMPARRASSVGDSGDFDETDHLGQSLEKPLDDVLEAAELIRQGLNTGLRFEQAAVGFGGAGYFWHHKDNYDLTRSSVVPPVWQEDMDACGPEADVEAAEAGPGSDVGDGVGEEDTESEADPEQLWATEVQETFLRCIKERFDPANARLELNGLKIAENREFVDCARYMLTTLLALCLPPAKADIEYAGLFAKEVPDSKSVDGKRALLKAFLKHLVEWKSLLLKFVQQDAEDDQIELLLALEEFCACEGVFEGMPHNSVYDDVFQELLKLLYQHDVVSEGALLTWADEKEHASESEKKYLRLAAEFIEWLQNASEEDDDDEEDDEDD